MPAGTGVDTIIVSARELGMGALEQRLFMSSLILPSGRFAGHLPLILRVSGPKKAPAGEHSPLLIVLDSIASVLFAALLAACHRHFPLFFLVSVTALHS